MNCKDCKYFHESPDQSNPANTITQCVGMPPNNVGFAIPQPPRMAGGAPTINLQIMTVRPQVGPEDPACSLYKKRPVVKAQPN